MHLLGGQFVKNSIRTCQNVIQLFAPIFLVVNVRIANYDVGVAAKLLFFGLEVAEGAADGESAREDTIGAN